VVRIQRNRDWPVPDPKSTVKKETHQDDIMTVVYDYQIGSSGVPGTPGYRRGAGILFTGGHDGTLYGWNFDTGSIKYRLHDKDPSCLVQPGENAIK